MSRSVPVLLIAVFLLSACDSTESPSGPTCDSSSDDSNGVTVKTGVYNFFLSGYSERELTISGTLVHFCAKHRPGSKPDLTYTGTVSREEWYSILALTNSLEGLKEVIGCPGCLDGATEWIEVIQSGNARKVKFECGMDVEEIEALLAILRPLRFQFASQVDLSPWNC